jgi:hypothetical protein
LKDEEEHRARHLRGECLCEVIFEGEDREKKLRTRSGKGKFKGNGKEIIRGENGGNGTFGHGAIDQGIAKGEPGGCGGGRRDIGENKSTEHNGVIRMEENCARQSWEEEFLMEAYEYVGYYINNDESQSSQGTDPGQSYAMACGGYDQQGQLPMGQIGAGMKWYPQDQQYPQPPQLPSAIVVDVPRGPRAISEPIGKCNHPGPVTQVQVPAVRTQPMVVSSDMMRTESL